MKMLLSFKFIVVCLVSILFIGCDTSSISTNEEILSGQNSKVYQKAKLSLDIFSENVFDNPISVTEAKKKNRIGDKLVIEGFIGGQKRPFASNRASFILADLSLEACDVIPGDSCPTPWDVCCEDRKVVLGATMNIQFLDKNGSLIHGTVEGVQGLKPGLKIRIHGKVSDKSLPESMVLNAEFIQAI